MAIFSKKKHLKTLVNESQVHVLSKSLSLCALEVTLRLWQQAYFRNYSPQRVDHEK